MSREITIYGGLEVVVKEDYLKVVKEKELYKNKFEKVMNDDTYLKTIERLEKELKELKRINMELYTYSGKEELEKIIKEKDEEIKILKEESEEYVKSQIIIKDNYKNKIKEKDKEIERLKEKITCLEFGLEKDDEELWILEYIYEKEGVRKNVILDPQPLEEIHELVGMDCDNWISWSINRVKEVK